jgi:tetratricopeptide (TPR) repeat protein
MARPLTFAGAGLWYKKRQGRDRARQLEKAEMTKTMVRSVLVAAVLATGSFAAGAQNAPTTSPALGDVFTAAQAAMQAKKWDEVEAKAQEALSKQKKPDDIYAAHYFLLEVDKAKRNNAGIIEHLEGMLNSGFSPGPDAQAQFRKALVSAYYQQKNYPQAIKHGTDLIKSGKADGDIYTVVGQAYYQQKNYDEAIKIFNDRVTAAEKAGRRPERNELVLLQSSYDKSGNAAQAQATLEKLVRHYPSSDTWLALLYEVKKERLDPRQRVQLYRLMDSTGNLKHPSDFIAYSEAATSLGLPNEAANVLENGLNKAKAFPDGQEKERAERYLKSNRERAESGKGELAQLEKEAQAAATGDAYVALGMAQLSFGQYDAAVQSLKAGIAKGGLKNAADAQVTLGVAQLKAGQKAEAAKTFRAVESDDELTTRIAKLWALHAS